MFLRPSRWMLSPLIATLVACAGGNAAQTPPPSLWGSAWQLIELGGQTVMPDPMATLAFAAEGQVSGQGSCNRFFGPVDIKGDRLSFGPLGSTKMACIGGASQQEARYLGALHKAQRYEVKDGMLLIHVEGMSQPLRFTRSTRPQ